MKNYSWEEVLDIENNAFANGKIVEIERVVSLLEGLREQYNLESMDLNEIRVARYEALSSAIDLIKGESK